MTAPFPHQYDVDLRWVHDTYGVLSAPGHPILVAGAPADFDGSDAWWSPEHMLTGAVATCLMLTFLAIADRQHLTIGAYASHGKAIVDKTREGILFTSIAIDVEIRAVSEDVLHAEAAFEKAKRACIVSNVLKLPVEARVSVVAS
jgi:organic hydroperoxide reductase OsmC/OhrA